MRDCANCFHRKPVLKEDGTWTAECEKWDCEFQSRENMIEKTKAMDNDLISRSALIQHAFTASFDGVLIDVVALADIDNAPTVHGIVAFVERPKGEWILHQDSKTWECNKCGKNQVMWSNFCPNCGADMRGKDK